MLKSFWIPLQKLSTDEKKNLIFLTLAYFFSLMSYPIIRSSSDAFFLQTHGVKNWPWVTFYSVIVLSICIFLFSKVQAKIGVKKLYALVSFFSVAFFLCSAFALKADIAIFSYATYIWKECYIVILLHLCLAFFNTHFSYDFAKSFFGPFGAVTSIGPIIGGAFTSFFTKEIGVFWLVIVGALICLLTPLAFLMLSERTGTERKERPQENPLASVRDIWPYVATIVGIIMVTQFIINVANFKFNFVVQNNFAAIEDKTTFFGKIYTLINILTLVIQLVVTPIALRSMSLRANHFSIVGLHLLVFLPLLILGGQVVWAVSAVFICAKGLDYSLFGVAKEMLYYPLKEYQKYGAKYIVDMVMYRFSKGLVSLSLTQVQNFRALDALISVAVLIWGALVFYVFRLHGRLKRSSER
ncbi:MAG: hypothetical protein OXB88_10565 [Bacteriovoracales bacterium]|nr:hypothetical protein [Bacteriovoracales bacterium]